MASFQDGFLAKMNKIDYNKGNNETWHLEADEILCDCLISIGYRELVEAWEEVPKGYV